ncbi:ATP-binding protein, partial [Photobacterium sanctipauli]
LGVTATFERQQYMSFSDPMFSIRRGVITHNKSVNDYQQLNKKTIAVEKGFALNELLPTLLPSAWLKPVADSNEAISAILSGTAFGYVGDAVVLSNLLKQQGNPALTLSILPGLPTKHLHFSAPKGKHKLLSRINFALEDIKRDSMPAIYNQWLTPEQQNMFTHYGQLKLSQEERNWLDGNPTISVGVHQDWGPYDFVDDQNRHSGLSADLLDILSYELGVKFKPQSNPSYAALTESFIDGEVMMLSAVAETEESSLQMYFSAPYIDEPWVLFGHAGASLGGLFTDSEPKVGVISGTAGEELLATLCSTCKPTFFMDQASAFRALQQNTVDQVLSSLHHASPLLQSSYIGQFKMIGQIQPENLLPLRFAVNYRHPILHGIIDKALATIPKEEFDRLEHKWLTYDYQEGLAPMEVAKWAGLISALGLMVIVSIIGWNRKMAQEILQRKTAERRAKRAEQRLQQLADNLDGIVLQHVQPDPDKPLALHFTFISAGITELLHINADQLLSAPSSLLEQMLLDDEQSLENSMLRACQQGHWDHEQAMKCPSGKPKWVQFKSRITPHEDGGYYWNTVVTDISLLKQQQLALDDARKKAEIATAAKSQFLATMSHEVRTPISGILGLLELMQDQPLNEETRSLHGGLTQSARNMLHIVNDILDFSKIEAGKLELSPADIALGTTLARIIQPQSIHAQQKGLAFHYWQDPNLAESHFVDDIRLHQILNNFLNNAIKFTQQGTISLVVDALPQPSSATSPTTEDGIQHVRFSVKDTGIGISPAQQQALFQPFEQADQSTSRRFGGTGLGLAIARKLVEQMQGEITLSSEEAKGSTFSVLLPLAITKQPEPTRTPQMLAGKRALLFGYFLQREELCQYLEHQGVVTNVAPQTHPHAICNTLKQQQPDIACIAQSLWQQLGIDSTWLSTHLPSCKVIVISQNPMLSPEPLDHQWCLSVNPLLPDNLMHVITEPVSAITNSVINAPVEQAARESRIEAEKNGRLILVAEDHPVNQQVIANQLEKIGVHADIVDNGAQAIEALQQHHYGLILSDCHMPEMDGYTLATTLRLQEEFAHLPIIALTANAVQGEENRCIDAGMNDFLIKPVSIDKLKAVIEQWLPSAPEPEPEQQQTQEPASLEDDFSALFGGITAELEAPTKEADSPILDSDDAKPDQFDPSRNKSVLDRNKILAIFGDADLSDNLIEEFKQNHQHDLQLLEQALLNNNQASAADVAHRMKGAARMLECEALAMPLEQIEHQAGNQQLSPNAHEMKQLKQLSQQL